jgi:hypothetical protein
MFVEKYGSIGFWRPGLRKFRFRTRSEAEETHQNTAVRIPHLGIRHAHENVSLRPWKSLLFTKVNLDFAGGELLELRFSFGG